MKRHILEQELRLLIKLVLEGKTIVGAGAVVSRSLPDDCTAVGIPAKPIKFGK